MARDPIESDSELFRRLARPKLAVRDRNQSWPLYLGYAALAVVAVVVFTSLSKQRTAPPGAQPAIATPATSAPPPILPQAPAVAMPLPATLVQPMAPIRPMMGALPMSGGALAPDENLHAPVVIVDLGHGEDATPAAANLAPTPKMASPAMQAAAGDAAPAASARADNEHFAASVALKRPETVTATHLSSTSTVAPQGTIIPAVLETAINSSLPGYVRAVVSRDVRGFDGSRVLIPRGTRLIGEYKSGAAAGQSRAFVVWTRLLTPDGVSVDIGSPAADRRGGGGTRGRTTSHFLRRFGGAILLSVLQAGLDAGVNQFSRNTSTVVIGTPQQASNVAALALQRDIDIPTTISVPQGAPIRVFVARDLDFSAGLSQ